MTLSILVTLYFLSLLCLGVLIAACIVWMFDKDFLNNFINDWRL